MGAADPTEDSRPHGRRGLLPSLQVGRLVGIITELRPWGARCWCFIESIAVKGWRIPICNMCWGWGWGWVAGVFPSRAEDRVQG